MRFVKRAAGFVKRLVHTVVSAGRALLVVICRPDLPANPRWRERGYPYANCWDIDEFFASPFVPYEEKRRIWWEAYWRLRGRYRRDRPFFEVYVGEPPALRRVDGEWRDRVLKMIIAAGWAHGIVPGTARVFEEVLGPLVRSRA